MLNKSRKCWQSKVTMIFDIRDSAGQYRAGLNSVGRRGWGSYLLLIISPSVLIGYLLSTLFTYIQNKIIAPMSMTILLAFKLLGGWFKSHLRKNWQRFNTLFLHAYALMQFLDI